VAEGTKKKKNKKKKKKKNVGNEQQVSRVCCLRLQLHFHVLMLLARQFWENNKKTL